MPRWKRKLIGIQSLARAAGSEPIADLFPRQRAAGIDPATQQARTEVIDVEEIKRTGARAKDVILQDGDRVEVPEKGVVF